MIVGDVEQVHGAAGDAAVLDNLTIHKQPAVQAAIEREAASALPAAVQP